MAEPTPPGATAAHQDLRNRATADVVAFLGVLRDAIGEGIDVGEYIAEQTGNWTVTHAQQALLVLGMVCEAANVPTEVLLEIGRALITEPAGAPTQPGGAG